MNQKGFAPIAVILIVVGGISALGGGIYFRAKTEKEKVIPATKIIPAVSSSSVVKVSMSTAECDDKTNINAKYECYINIAKRTSDTSVCDTIGNENYKFSCYENVAAITKNSSICDKFGEGAFRTVCYMRLSDSDPSLCDKFNESDSIDVCYGNLGIIKSSPTLCNHIQDKNRKFTCYTGIGIKNKDTSVCGFIQNLSDRNLCEKEVRGEPVEVAAACSKFPEEAKDGCYLLLAGEKGADPSLCNKINDPQDKGACLKIFEQSSYSLSHNASQEIVLKNNKIISDLKEAQVLAETQFDGRTYDSLPPSGSVFTGGGSVYDNFEKLASDIVKQGGKFLKLLRSSGPVTSPFYIFWVGLNSEKYYCVDSEGNKGEINTEPKNTDIKCSFPAARNTQRWYDVNAILNAIGQRIADNRGVFETGCKAGPIPTSPTKISSGAYDIGSCLMPKYLSVLRLDPSLDKPTAFFSSITSYDTYYTIERGKADGRVTVSAPRAELGERIWVTR